MSIKIKTLKGEIFDLPTGYKIEATRTNPLFTKKGSQTVPITFPSTDKNRRLTENAYRLDNYGRPTEKTKVVVDSGSTSQTGLLAIQSASESSISANIGWDEAEMYANMSEMKLVDLPNLPVFVAQESDDLDVRLDAMLSHMHAVMSEAISAEYSIFSLVLNVESSEDSSGNENVYLDVLNETFMNTSEEFGDNRAASGEIGGFVGKTNRIIDRVVDNEVVPFDVPRAYGISPFIRVWKVLELVFGHYGFTVENNPFYEHGQLRRLVVLNNTMDSIITGRLSYRDMMPDITVEEFLDGLFNKFGMLYFINSNTNTVHFEFIRDILNASSGSIDLTKYKTAPLPVTYSENKQLRLEINKEIELIKKKYDTFEEFLDAHDFQFYDYDGIYYYAEINWNYSLIFGISLRYYATLDQYKSIGNVIAPISEDWFNWDKKDDLAYEKIEMKDLSLPYAQYCYPTDNTEKPILMPCLFYLVGYKHNYSDVTIEGESSDSQNPAKFAFAFSWGKTVINDLSSTGYNFSFGSQDNRTWDGQFQKDASGNKYDISLTLHREDGLFNRYWKEYDAYLRHSAFEVNAKLKIPEVTLSQVRMYKMITIDNQPFLAEEIKYNPGSSIFIPELKLRTLRLYYPYDLATEQSIVAYSAQKYYWRLTSVKTPNIVGDYTIISGYGPAGASNRRQLIWNPPTEEEYQTQQTRVYVYNYRIKMTNGGAEYDIEEVVTFYPTPV